MEFMLYFAREMFFDDSDDEECDRSLLPKCENYAEEIIPRMQHKQFKQHFRLDVDTFEDLLHKLHMVSPVNNNKSGQPEVAQEKQTMITIWCLANPECMITIWCLANPECFRSVADRFGISKSTCWSSLYRTCSKLLKINEQFNIICWPDADRAEEITASFKVKHNSTFPGIIGAIDGSHIPVAAPKHSGSSYVCRKGFHSILLQGTCDHRLLFTDCYAGEAGSIHDSLLFRRSSLSRRIRTNEISFYNDYHLVGDGAYTLSTTLMKPFKNNGYLTGRESNFNKSLSKARVVIEMAFGFLKGRFRRLKFLDTKRMDLASLLIISACIMHNICILQGDTFMDGCENVEQGNEDLEDVEDDDEEMPPRAVAVTKRINIINALPMINTA